MLDERIQGVITFLHKICPFPPKPFPPREQQRWHTDLYYEDIKYLEYFHLYFGRLKDISLPRSYFSGLTGQICLDSTNDVPHSKFSNDEGEGVHIASSWITIILSLVIIFISNLQRIWSYLTNCMTTSCAKHIIRGYDSLSPLPLIQHCNQSALPLPPHVHPITSLPISVIIDVNTSCLCCSFSHPPPSHRLHHTCTTTSTTAILK